MLPQTWVARGRREEANGFDYCVMPAIFFLVGFLLFWFGIRRMYSALHKPAGYVAEVWPERIVLSVFFWLRNRGPRSAYKTIALQIFWQPIRLRGPFSIQVHGIRCISTARGAVTTSVLEAAPGEFHPSGWDTSTHSAQITRVCLP